MSRSRARPLPRPMELAAAAARLGELVAPAVPAADLTHAGVLGPALARCAGEVARALAEVRQADIVVAAAGVPGIITADMVKPGAAVLDVGVSRVVDPETGKSRVAGDVAPEVADVAGWISPNPGGVGPMTRAELLANVVAAAERQLAACR